jgi:hypothetical protein
MYRALGRKNPVKKYQQSRYTCKQYEDGAYAGYM